MEVLLASNTAGVWRLDNVGHLQENAQRGMEKNKKRQIKYRRRGAAAVVSWVSKPTRGCWLLVCICALSPIGGGGGGGRRGGLECHHRAHPLIPLEDFGPISAVQPWMEITWRHDGPNLLLLWKPENSVSSLFVCITMQQYSWTVNWY